MLALEQPLDEGDLTEDPEALTDNDKCFLFKRTKSHTLNKGSSEKLEDVKNLLQDLCAEQKASNQEGDDMVTFLQCGRQDHVRVVREVTSPWLER